MMPHYKLTLCNCWRQILITTRNHEAGRQGPEYFTRKKSFQNNRLTGLLLLHRLLVGGFDSMTVPCLIPPSGTENLLHQCVKVYGIDTKPFCVGVNACL